MAPSLPAMYPTSSGTCVPLSSNAVVCFDWAKSTLSQTLLPCGHESQPSTCSETSYPSRYNMRKKKKKIIRWCTCAINPQLLSHQGNPTPCHPSHQQLQTTGDCRYSRTMVLTALAPTAAGACPALNQRATYVVSQVQPLSLTSAGEARWVRGCWGRSTSEG